MLMVRSTHPDVLRNLAAEEFLLGEVPKRRHILFLWQGRDAVVVGKNQNPWRECRVKQVEEGGGVVARRVSGGGAVFHDLGNLNYAFFTPRKEYRATHCFDVVLAALRRLGIPAEMMGRTALAAGGRKFSGNAFCFQRESALHHGTLMLSTDLQKLKDYLEPSPNVVRTRAIPSRPSPVMNLAELKPDLTVGALGEAVAAEFSAACGEPAEQAGDEYLESVAWELKQKHASWDWRFGTTPPFDVELSGEFDWGNARLKLYVEKGVIEYAGLSIGGPAEDAAEAVEQALRDCTLEEEEILDRLKSLEPEVDRWIAREIANWIATA